MAKEKEALGRRAARTLSAMLLANVSGLILGIATIFAVARLLGPGNYGAYTIAVSYYLLIDAALYFGIGQYFNKRLSELEHDGKKEKLLSALSSGLILALAFSIALTLIGIGAAAYVAQIYAPLGVSFLTLAIASFVMFFSILFGACNSALIGFGEVRLAALTSIVENAIQLAACVILVLLGFGFNGAVAGIVIGYLAGFAVSLSALMAVGGKHVRLGFVFDKKEIRYAFKFCTPIALSNAVNNGANVFSTLLLGVFVTASLLGNFGLAFRGINIISVVAGTAPVAAIPVLSIALSRRSKKKKLEEAYNKSVLYSLLITLPIMVFTAAFAKPLIYLLATSRYSAAPLYLSLMSIGMMIYAPGIFASNLLIAGGQTRKLLKYTGIATLLQLVFLLILVPSYGALGAIAAAFFIGNGVITYLLVKGTAKHFKIKTDYSKMLKIFVSCAALALAFGLVYFIPGNALQLLCGAAVLFILYPIFAVLFRAVDKEDVKELRKAMSGIPALRKSAGFMISYISFLTGR